jgi:endonuclease V
MRMIELRERYISGFLAFREAPFLVELLNDLKRQEPQFYPQVLLVDGNGVLHHQGFGSACHIGVVADIPTIGVAKKLLFVDGLIERDVRKQVLDIVQPGGYLPLVGQSGVVCTYTACHASAL